MPLQAVFSDSLEQPVVHSPELNEKLKTAYKNKGSSYKPRTEHLNSDGSAKYINRLILEDSPYLIQHAHNPVNWYAWGNEAFEKAKRENKPIFLSIGYSTCHWCHVMERESFDNELIAEYLNQHFVAIKVDRERRPDVDKIYMTALMMVNGSGGWPMSSILTPEGSPFFSGTYLPPEMFMDVLKRATDLWQSQETQVRQIAEKITSLVQSRQRGLKLAEHIGKERIAIAVISLLNRFDELQGGFSQAPKFPNETYLFLLMDNVIREQDQDALNALKLTLDMMAQGGIYDQIGGGFHRYSTDNEWLTPHFEKMLYNQAHLARNYLQLFNVTHDMSYQRVVTQTLDYVLREMQADNGGFYSASDADTEGEEGKYFLWTPEEIQSVLPPELAKLAIALYGVTKTGNFSEHPVNETLVSDKLGSNILNLPVSIKEFSLSSKESSEQDLNTLYQKVDQIRQQLYQYRTSRIAPAIDRKVVTAWNGMMITTLAQAGKQLQKQNYIDAAIKVAEFLWQTHHYTEASKSQTEGRLSSSGLYRASLDGKASVSAIQADYAYLAQGYLALYDITSNRVWLERSEQLVKEMIRLFWDKEEGGFYMTALAQNKTQEPVLFDRPKDTSDGALPSGNAVALEVLSQLYFRTGNDYYHAKAMAMIASMSAIIKTSPVAFSYFLMAVNQLNFGETGSTQYGGKGHVRIEQQLLSHQFTNNKHQLELNFKINIDKGWHINSRYPLDEELIATSVSLGKSAGKHWKITRVVYPQGEELLLKFNDTPLSLYQNTVNIKVLIESDNSLTKTDGKVMMNPLPVQINYQTCSDSICLAPEEHRFTLFL